MASPPIDEGLMEHLLQSTPGVRDDAVGRLQYGAIMLIVDAFDRKVTRANFVDILDKAISLVDGAGRLGAFTATTGSENFNSREAIAYTQGRLNDEIARRAKSCVRAVETLKQCPRDEDPIN